MPAPNEFNALMTALFSEELGKMFSIIREERENIKQSLVILYLFFQ